MLDWTIWLYYFLYMQSGLIVGAGLSRKLAPGKKNGMSELKYGEKGRFAVGLGLSFGLQLFDVGYLLVWTCSTLVSAAWSFYPTMLVYVKGKLSELENNRGISKQFLVMKGFVEAFATVFGCEINLDDFAKDCKDKEKNEVIEYIKGKIKEAQHGEIAEYDEKMLEPEDISILAEMTV